MSSFNPFKQNVHDHDAPCVVCYVRSRGTQLMIPARDDCPNRWTEEYHGYLMTEHWGHKSLKILSVLTGMPSRFQEVSPAMMVHYCTWFRHIVDISQNVLL